MRRLLDWILDDRPASYLAEVRDGTVRRPAREADRVLFSHLLRGPVEGPLLAGLRSTPAVVKRANSQRRWFSRPALTPVSWTIEETVLLTGLVAAILLLVAPFAGPGSFGVDVPALVNASIDLQSAATPEAYAALEQATNQGGVLSQAVGKLSLMMAG